MSAKIFVSFLVGSLTGAAICYYVMRSEFEKTLEKEVAEFKEKYAAKKERSTEKPSFEREDISEPETKEKEKVYDELVKKQVINYESYAKKYRGGKNKPSINVNMEKLTKKDMLDAYEEQLEEEEFEEDEDLYPFEESDIPFSIDSDKFSGDSLHDKVTLLYFKKDGILLADDGDEEFEDPEKYLGSEWQEAIGEFESNVAYIRNDKNMTDYEILEMNGHYIKD